jgi:glutaredoxin 3|tara:strand:+ start:226 stop:486 length:261 start_codon:yes stop_codon:yes gene_type:complete
VKKVEMFTQDFCGYCTEAKTLINTYIATGMFEELIEYNIMIGSEHKKNLKKRLPGAKTVPQIFFDGEHIGGYNDLADYIENHTSFG